MWKLKIGDGGGHFSEYLYSTNNFVGRQTWEFDPEAGTPEERAEVEKARHEYHKNRFEIKPCGDLLLKFQVVYSIYILFSLIFFNQCARIIN